MQNHAISPFARDDTLFGVCHALGEDFGFNPIFLRLPLSVLLLWNPVVVIGVYAAAAVLVAFSRLVVPAPRSKPAELQAAEQQAPVETPEEQSLPLAA